MKKLPKGCRKTLPQGQILVDYKLETGHWSYYRPNLSWYCGEYGTSFMHLCESCARRLGLIW